MQHLHLLSRTPELAQNVAPEVKLTFFGNILNLGMVHDLVEDSLLYDLVQVMIPVFVNKNPQNPLPGSD